MKKAFTLIELLIVVAIIAILAAIAVPNFLEAQVRSKAARGVADMRSMATAIESYKIDTNSYPPDYQCYQWRIDSPRRSPGAGSNSVGPQRQFAEPEEIPSVPLFVMTTPVAYMTGLPSNPFILQRGVIDGDPSHYEYKCEKSWKKIVLGSIAGLPWAPNSILYNESGELDADMSRSWVLSSIGPDLTPSGGPWALFGDKVIARAPTSEWDGAFLGDPGAIYDSTNGTVSNGDIVRLGP